MKTHPKRASILLGRLARRAEHLRKRLASPAPAAGRGEGYAASELSALDWALAELFEVYGRVEVEGPSSREDYPTEVVVCARFLGVEPEQIKQLEAIEVSGELRVQLILPVGRPEIGRAHV